jgi:hypothetical protein
MYITVSNIYPWGIENEELIEPDSDRVITYRFFLRDSRVRSNSEAKLREAMLAQDDITSIPRTDKRFKPYHLDYSRRHPVFHGFTLEIYYPYVSNHRDIPEAFKETLKLCKELEAMEHDPEIQEYVGIAIECERYLIRKWLSMIKKQIPKLRSHEIIISNILVMYFKRYLFNGICSTEHMRIIIYTAYYFMVRLGYWYRDYSIHRVGKASDITCYQVFCSNLRLEVKESDSYIMEEIHKYIA